MRRAYWLAAIAFAGVIGQLGFAQDHGRKFYPDDPLWREPAPRPVSGITTRTVDHIYDFLYGSYVTPRLEGKAAKRAPQRALDVNTLGEVPDSAWYTNRHSVRRMSIEELQRGPGNTTPPDPNGPWRITSAKRDGITPGFVIEDAQHNRYVLKFDPPRHPELCSAADVIGSKLFHALGYNTPENYVVHFRREQLEVAEGVMHRPPNGKKTPLTGRLVDELLRAQPKLADGTYRALASRWLDGKVVGPFDYRDTRSDDPNDTVPHQHRRVLRGLAVIAAWVNHHDTSQINTMDTLVTENGSQYIKHHLIDFGSILGSRGDRQKEPWIGHQYSVMHKETAMRAMTLGLYVSRWERSDYPRLKGVGLLDAWSFDPLQWNPEVPNPAFLMMDNADAFWAAKQVAAFTDDEIRAIVETGKLSDKRAADWIAECLIKRRDKVAQAWFSKVLALDRLRVTDGGLEWVDLAAGFGPGTPSEIQVQWKVFNNDQGTSEEIPGERSARLPEMRGDGYWMAVLESPQRPKQSVHVYVRKRGEAAQVVGVDRTW
ncbi:MAG: hypothetical protein HXY18_19815 [Bryobacteraceae bacterium]|nr:hypothetical protein [Bryobacteraceae bacterium]